MAHLCLINWKFFFGDFIYPFFNYFVISVRKGHGNQFETRFCTLIAADNFYANIKGSGLRIRCIPQVSCRSPRYNISFRGNERQVVVALLGEDHFNCSIRAEFDDGGYGHSTQFVIPEYIQPQSEFRQYGA